MQMMPRTYVIRQIEESNRAEHGRRIQRAEERGDPEEVELIKESFEGWEREQGQQEERLVCPICGDQCLVPTAKGDLETACSTEWNAPSWDRVSCLGCRSVALEESGEQMPANTTVTAEVACTA